MDWFEIGKLLLTFLGGSAVGSLVTQWVGWRIEKLKSRRQARAQMISDWRQMIASLPQLGGWSLSDPACAAILRSPAFISLEHHLEPVLLDRIRNPKNLVIGSDFPRRKLSERVAQLEKEWGLI